MDFITQNGQKKVVLNIASFKDSSDLKKVVMKCLGQANVLNNIDVSNAEGLGLAKILDLIMQVIINADSSDEFENAVFKCLERSVYDGKAITLDLFDEHPEAREDYYEIVSKCCEENLRPFFKSLVSEFKTRFETMTKKDQEQ